MSETTDYSSARSPKIRRWAWALIFVNVLPIVPALFFIIDDLQTRGEFLDGLMAFLMMLVLGVVGTSILCGVLALTRRTTRWAKIWLGLGFAVSAVWLGYLLLMFGVTIS